MLGCSHEVGSGLAIVGALLATHASTQDHGAQVTTTAGPTHWLSGPGEQALGDFYPPSPLTFLQDVAGPQSLLQHFRLAQSMMGKPGYSPGDPHAFPMLFAPSPTAPPAPPARP